MSTGLGYADLTGRFLYHFTQGNEYVLVEYNYDTNTIYVVPLKNFQGPTIVTGWEILHKLFTTFGVAPSTYIQNNKTSKFMKDTFTDTNVTCQLVPPHNHRANATESAIKTFQTYFITIYLV